MHKYVPALSYSRCDLPYDLVACYKESNMYLANEKTRVFLILLPYFEYGDAATC